MIQNKKNDPNFVILDVRAPEEFVSKHLENSININYRSMTFRNDLNRLDKDKTYLIHCRTENRSGSALLIMKEF